MDKNGKIAGKISIIDILAVVLIAAVIAGTVYRFTSHGTLSLTANDRRILYSVKITGVRTFTRDYYEVGMKCFDRMTGECIGEIVGISDEPLQKRATSLDGSIGFFDVPDVMVVNLDIETDGTFSSNAWYANGTYELKTGAELFLNTVYIDVVCEITGITVLD